MSVVKSFSVGEGDMFYINHDSDSFSIIDCCMSDVDRYFVIQEIKKRKEGKQITRFISTHPDDDHIRGLEYLDDETEILNFYCVKNETHKDEETDDFVRYCQLKDSDKAFYLVSGCARKWLNQEDEERGSSGIEILWPKTDNKFFKAALEIAKEGGSPNNISPIIKYSLAGGATFLWMGDLESDFMENIAEDISLPAVDILFAPHHGRESGKVPEALLAAMSPRIVVIGEAPSKDLNYYCGYNTITQNSSGDITFEAVGSQVHIYVLQDTYSVDFLDNLLRWSSAGHYIGTLTL